MFRKLVAQLLILVLLITPAAASAAARESAQANATVEPSTILLANFQDYDLTSSEPLSVIIELEGAPLVEAGYEQEQEQSLLRIQNQVLAALESQGIDFQLQQRYTYLLNGLVGTLPANQVKLLASVPQIVDVGPNYETHEALVESLPAIDVPLVWESPLGYDGSGVVVGVIDSRIDWRHPAFGGGIGPGYRLIGGWDLINNRPLEASTELGPSVRHGTHVASIVAAVAPGASIRGYAISSPETPTNLARILGAVEMAVRDGVDVINLSNGSEYGHDDTIRNRVFDRAIDAGVVLVTANGNGGSHGERTTWTYAAPERVIAVGNADARVRALLTHDASSTKISAIKFAFSVDIDGLDGNTYEYVDCKYGAPSDFYDADGNSRVAGKIALMSRGGTPAPFREKMENAAAAGAVAALIHNNIDEPLSSTVGSTEVGDIPSFAVSLSEGQFLLAAEEKFITIERGYDFKMHASSSKGPTPMLNVKPDVVAPGHMIIGAYPYPEPGVTPASPAFQGDDGAWYVANSGTSMAAPHVAGIATILKQAHPEWTPEQIKLALMNTAIDIKDWNGHSYRPIEQGAGLVNALRALQPNVFISPGALSFKEVSMGSTHRQLELESNGNQTITYRVQVEKYDETHDYELELPATVTVPANDRVEVPVNLQVGADLPPTDMDHHLYCGFIYFENVADPTDSYRVPYHFVNKMVVSQLSVTPLHLSYHPDGANKEVTLSFTIGQPVNDLCFFLSGYEEVSRFANTGPLAPGTYTLVWDGRFNDPDFTIADGMYSVYPSYQLEPGGAYYSLKNANYQTAPTFAYLLIDSEAPRVNSLAVSIAPEENHLLVTALIDDMINNVLHDAPLVVLNGVGQEIINYVDPSGPGRGNDYAYLETAIEVDLSTHVTLLLELGDRAGNWSRHNYLFSPLVVDNPSIDYADKDVYTVTGHVIPGMAVTVADQWVEVDGEGYFAAQVAVPSAVNSIQITAHVPGWDNFVPLRHQLQVIREDGITTGVKFTPRTFNLKSQGQWVQVELTAPSGKQFANSDAENIRLLIGDQTLVAVDCKVQGNRLRATFERATVARTFASPGQRPIIVTGTLNGTPCVGFDQIQVISP